MITFVSLETYIKRFGTSIFLSCMISSLRLMVTLWHSLIAWPCIGIWACLAYVAGISTICVRIVFRPLICRLLHWLLKYVHIYDTSRVDHHELVHSSTTCIQIIALQLKLVFNFHLPLANLCYIPLSIYFTLNLICFPLCFNIMQDMGYIVSYVGVGCGHGPRLRGYIIFGWILLIGWYYEYVKVFHWKKYKEDYRDFFPKILYFSHYLLS